MGYMGYKHSTLVLDLKPEEYTCKLQALKVTIQLVQAEVLKHPIFAGVVIPLLSAGTIMFDLHMAAVATKLHNGSSGFHQPSRQLRIQNHHVISELWRHVLAQNAVWSCALRARSCPWRQRCYSTQVTHKMHIRTWITCCKTMLCVYVYIYIYMYVCICACVFMHTT